MKAMTLSELHDAGCDHPAMRDGTCAECDETCTCHADPETAWPDVDDTCPIHGEAS